VRRTFEVPAERRQVSHVPLVAAVCMSMCMCGRRQIKPCAPCCVAAVCLFECMYVCEKNGACAGGLCGICMFLFLFLFLVHIFQANQC
jgi:hypothetical protein